MFEKVNIKEDKELKIILIFLDIIILFVIPIFKQSCFQDILFVIFSFITIFIVSPPKISSIILISFIIRIVLVFVDIYFIPLPEAHAGSDVPMFESIAFKWSQMGLPWLLSHFISGSLMYSWIIGLIYSFIGRNLFIVQGINALFGALIVLNVYLIGKELWSYKEAYLAAIISSLFPTLVYFSAILLREISVIWSFTLGVYFIVVWFKRMDLRSFIVGVVLFLLSLGFHTAMIYSLLVLIIPVIILLISTVKNGYPKSLSKFLSEILVLSLAFIFIYKTSWGLEKIGGIISNNTTPPTPPVSINRFKMILSTLINYLPNVEKIAARDRAAYLTALQIRGFLDFFWQTPIRVIFFLFSPFVWQVRIPLDLFGFFDSLLYIIMGLIILFSLRKIFKNGSALLVFFFLLVGVVLFASTTSNYGTALRHRAKFSPLMIVLCVPFLSQYTRKLNRVLFWEKNEI